eukprot:Awhi_evm1s2919
MRLSTCMLLCLGIILPFCPSVLSAPVQISACYQLIDGCYASFALAKLKEPSTCGAATEMWDCLNEVSAQSNIHCEVVTHVVALVKDLELT